MRKSLIVLAIAAVAVAGCSNKQAAPTQPATPAQSPAPTASPSGSTTGNPTTTPPAANNQANTAPAPAPAASTPKPAPKPPAGSAKPLTITKQQYDKLQLNLSYDEVQKQIGLGKLVKQTEYEAIYDYNVDGGGTAELTFYNGILNSKAMNS